jgi:uncharacterized PurR-regulated membrane protein YhhQ (DUF165 family)
MAKKLQMDSKYNEYDSNKDGIVNDVELSTAGTATDLENRDKKEDQQRRMAWMGMISMIVFTVFLFLPVVSNERVEALSDLLSMFYIAQAGVVASFFGAQAYINR